MRRLRIVILACFLASSLFLIGRAINPKPPSDASTYATAPKVEPEKASVWGFMYFNSPFSLFPPNAAIRLTDDNSTSFAARPAAFGPNLSQAGLSGQLWVGGGFAEFAGDGDGELGCSDLPDWHSWDTLSPVRKSLRTVTEPRVTTSQRKRTSNRAAKAKGGEESGPSGDDGTDEYLQEGMRRSSSSSYADIQSIQQSAEIGGKVVLLKRGGCGFLEKVLWAQRRGAIAVIVGDNQKGGPLIQMFAHGEDVDNVTIPSVFTARTTAQLLSSLADQESLNGNVMDKEGKSVVKVQQRTKPRDAGSNFQNSASARSADNMGSATPPSKTKRSFSSNNARTSSPSLYKRSWLSRLFGVGHSSHPVDEGGRPSSGDRLDWILVEDWSEEKDRSIRETMDKSKKGVPSDGEVNTLQSGGRDAQEPETPKKTAQTDEIDTGDSNPYRALPKVVKGAGDVHGLVDPVFSSRDGRRDGSEHSSLPESPHEGLWVTITPTGNGGAFFDTLLVLVVSPLITITLLYALLLLRAGFRRRRWRAPKSVVEQLPVRTYHTVASSSSSSSSSRQPSPSSASPTTPLLQQGPPPTRPRSRTTTGVPESDNLRGSSAAVPPHRPSSRSGAREHEKVVGSLSSEWRKYRARQVECVVCLEEYVDGVSRVMSLPCGHEFHADCMYVFPPRLKPVSLC
jgi:hypothetical protein